MNRIKANGKLGAVMEEYLEHAHTHAYKRNAPLLNGLYFICQFASSHVSVSLFNVPVGVLQ